MSGPLDFTNQNIEDTYQRVLQTDGTDIYDGTGSLFTVTAVAAPAGPNQSIQFNDAGATSGSGNLTFDKNTNVVSLTGSISAVYGFTGSLLGTAATASNTPNALVTGSITNNVITLNKGDGSSFTLTVNTGSGTNIDTSSFVTTASFNSFTSSYNTGSFSGSLTGSLFGTASWAYSASQAISASYSTTASYALNGGVTSVNVAGTGLSINQTTGAIVITGTGGGGGGNTATGSYGSFYSTVTQTNVASTARSMSLNITDISNGVSISGSTNPYNTYIKTENPGIYDIQFSAQVDKTDSGTDEIWIWLRKNGVNVDDSATSLQLVGNGAHYVAAWNFFVNAAANDYYQLMWYSPDANVRLHAEAGFGVVPAIPSLIVTVNRVDQFLSNTGSFSGSFTGEFFGTASWASQSISSSYATSASYALSSSYATSASYAPSSSYSLSSSYALSSSYSLSSSYALSSSQATSASYALSSSYSLSSSYAQTASYALNALLPGGLNTQIQFNSASVFSGSSNFTFAKDSSLLTLQGPFSQGASNQALGTGSHAEGGGSQALGNYSHAEGVATTLGTFSHAEGGGFTGQYGYLISGSVVSGIIYLSQSYGDISGEFNPGGYVIHLDNTTQVPTYLETDPGIPPYFDSTNTIVTLVNTSFNNSNVGTLAIIERFQPKDADIIIAGDVAHAEGDQTYALGIGSHTEGSQTTALGQYSHAEGIATRAIGNFSHAEGNGTQAVGQYSHAEGLNTITLGNFQHVQGQYNISSSAQSAFIIGNGTSDATRSNLVFASGSQFQISGSLFVTGSTQGGGSGHILTYNTSSGEVFFTASSAIGGGGNPGGSSPGSSLYLFNNY